MSIVSIRMCDVCKTRHENTTSGYSTFGEFTDINGDRYEVCSECVLHLMQRRPAVA